MAKERVRYYSPVVEDYQSELVYNKGAKGSKTQKDLKGWWQSWKRLSKRLEGRNASKKTWKKYENLYGNRKNRIDNFKYRWNSDRSSDPNYYTMSKGLWKQGYWPNPKDTPDGVWKKYTNKMFNSLVDYYKPDRLYNPLKRPINKLIYKRAIRTAAGLGGLKPQ